MVDVLALGLVEQHHCSAGSAGECTLVDVCLLQLCALYLLSLPVGTTQCTRAAVHLMQAALPVHCAMRVTPFFAVVESVCPQHSTD